MKNIVAMVGAVLVALTPLSSGYAQVPAPPDATRLQLARDILNASGGAQAMQVRMRSLFASMQDMIKSYLPKSDSQVSAAAEATIKYMTDQEVEAAPQMIEQVANIYANNLSEQELRDMLAWTASPSGRAIQAKMPIISQQLIASQGPLMKKIVAGAMATALDRACEEAKCTESDRTTITAIVQKSFSPS